MKLYRQINKEKLSELSKKYTLERKEKRRDLKEPLPDKVYCYNADGTLYKAFKTKADALRDVGYNPESTAQINRFINTELLWLNKYWKYEN